MTRSIEWALNKWALMLGWPPIVKHVEFFDGITVVFYTSGECTSDRKHFALHVNQQSCGYGVYTASVYAIRYRMCSGWYQVRLSTRVAAINKEASRLHDVLAREWFDAYGMRRKYRNRHPHSTNWSWKRLGNEPQPFLDPPPTRCQ
jgi:hypothetical protein